MFDSRCKNPLSNDPGKSANWEKRTGIPVTGHSQGEVREVNPKKRKPYLGKNGDKDCNSKNRGGELSAKKRRFPPRNTSSMLLSSSKRSGAGAEEPGERTYPHVLPVLKTTRNRAGYHRLILVDGKISYEESQRERARG